VQILGFSVNGQMKEVSSSPVRCFSGGGNGSFQEHQTFVLAHVSKHWSGGGVVLHVHNSMTSSESLQQQFNDDSLLTMMSLLRRGGVGERLVVSPQPPCHLQHETHEFLSNK